MRSLALFALLVPTLLLGALPTPSQAESLESDGRAGVVSGVQGQARVRPDGRERFTPLGPKDRVFPGDLLLTATRGAHALDLALGTTQAILGPGTQAEVLADGLRLLAGELEVRALETATTTVRGPGGFSQQVKGTLWVRADAGATTVLTEEPRWLTGYRAAAGDEWMGALLAQVDGRDVPLVVSRYRVDAEIRDQISRTTIEQSFRNTTDQRLEGVFYFPLPADASISGFGMWIGGELVEADIVERQRARQIYEDILKRKKDPGLLEWEGGNLFKARVFPIEPHSEKRIRIRYTQVLPLEGTSYRYRLALRSEMLRSKPLRELAINVRVVSTQALSRVHCPTHECVIRSTAHEAVATHSAQEVRPQRDFELNVEVAAHADLVTVPHRRGEDGWFALLLSPPDSGSGAFARDLVPESDPLDLILVADTSGSMDEAARAGQARFIEALLSTLGSKDRFRMVAGDVAGHWLVETPTEATAESTATAQAALAKRASLGWTDLEALLAPALAAASERTLVVYIGDGVGTNGDADPVALAARLKALGTSSKATVHAVAPSASYEARVLEALARIGSGSARAVGDSPEGAARDLLAEALRPVLRDVRIQIDGIATARVYPEQLPNVPAGRQQVIVGRFLPSDGAQEGTVTVEGSLGGRPVRYVAPLVVGASDAGNSFLPRLWARAHLDALLAQGLSAEVREEIVDLSARFGILTPLTSLLVLENDEERERYGVTRRVAIRDGERFFAQARDRAALEILRQQMQAAGRWRAGMREEMLRELARLGRDLGVPGAWPIEEFYGAMQGPASGYATMTAVGGGSSGGSWGARRGGSSESLKLEESRSRKGRDALAGRHAESQSEADFGDAGRQDGAAPPAPSASAAPARNAEPSEGGPPAQPSPEPSVEDFDEAAESDARSSLRERRSYAKRAQNYDEYGNQGGQGIGAWHGGLAAAYARWNARRGLGLNWLGFPTLTDEPPPQNESWRGEPWPQDVRLLLESLQRRGALRALPEGVFIELVKEQLHGPRSDLRAWSRSRAWLKQAQWRVDSEAWQGEPSSQWLLEERRGALHAATALARTRDAKARDGIGWSLALWDLVGEEPWRAWQEGGWTAEIVPSSHGGRAIVRLLSGDLRPQSVDFMIDTDRLVVQSEHHRDALGRTLRRVEREGWFEAAGRWWAARTVERGQDEVVTSTLSCTVRALAGAEWSQQLTEHNARLAPCVVLHGRLSSRTDAKDAVRQERATLNDLLSLVIEEARRSHWPQAREAFEAVATQQGARAGVEWMRAPLLLEGRAAEEGPSWIRAQRERIHGGKDLVGAARASRLLEVSAAVLSALDQLALLDELQPQLLAKDAPAATLRHYLLSAQRAHLLAASGQEGLARTAREQLAMQWPLRLEAQWPLENDLYNEGRYDPAEQFLRRLLGATDVWTQNERDQLQERFCDRLWGRGRLEALESALAAWAIEPSDADSARWRLLSLFCLRGQAAQADQALLARLALRPALKATPTRRDQAELDVCIPLALGDGWGFRVDRVLAEFEPALEALALHLLSLDLHDLSPLARIVDDWRFKRTDAAARVRIAMRDLLLAPGAAETLSPERIAFLVGHSAQRADGASAPEGLRLEQGLRARYDGEARAAVRESLASSLFSGLDQRSAREEAIDFARSRLLGASGSARKQRARELWARLLSTPDGMTEAGEPRVVELLSLLPALQDAQAQPQDQGAQAAQDLRALCARALQWLIAKQLGPAAVQATWSRAEAVERRKEATTVARRALLASLAAASDVPPAAQPWLRIERLGYGVELGEDLAPLLAEAGQMLLAPAPAEDDPVDRLLRERAAVALAFGASRRNAPDGAALEALRVFGEGERGQALATKDKPDLEQTLDWRYQIFRLLVAQDDVAALRQRLEQWSEPTRTQSRWRVARGYLEAELGHFAPATALLEEAAGLGELSAANWQAIASWYLVLKEDARRERALASAYDEMQEWELSNLLNSHAPRRGRGAQSTQIDPEAIGQLEALLRKASRPQDYVWHARNLYLASKDFRILAPLTQALGGHAIHNGYELLTQVGAIVDSVHEEATLDEWSAALDAFQKQELPKGTQRRVALLRARLLARASQVLQRDPSHASDALAQLTAAAKGPFEPGERLLMANYLRSLGTITDPQAARAQVALLRGLREGAAGAERLALGRTLAETYWAYNERRDAIATIEAVVAEARGQEDADAAAEVQAARAVWVEWLSVVGQFMDAERLLLAEFAEAPTPAAAQAVGQRLDQVRVRAFQAGGRVSLGQGETLFTALLGLWDQELREEPLLRSDRVRAVSELYEEAAKNRRLGGLAQRYEPWARTTLPWLAERAPLAASVHADRMARTLWVVASPPAAIAFLLDRHDVEPRWLDRIDGQVWVQSASLLASLRARSAALGALEGRLLRWVVAELEADLNAGGRQHGAAFWSANHKEFWAERAHDFASAALKVAELRSESAAIAMRCAQLLRNNLRRAGDGVAVLEAALSRGLLDSGGRRTLAVWLMEDRRFKDSLVLWTALATERPDHLEYSLKRAECTARVADLPAALALMKQIEQEWRARERYDEGVAWELGALGARLALTSDAAQWIEDAIARRIEATGYRGGRDERLSQYYSALSTARAAQGNTDAAVSAASAGLFSASPNNRNSLARATKDLLEALRRSRDLSAWIEDYEARVARDGTDAPVLRRTLAAVFRERRDSREAIRHLQAAHELAPEDAAIVAELIGVLDEAGQAEAAIQMRLQAITASPHDFSGHVDLARRLDALGRAEEAERARTTLAEMTPNQPEGHRQLAQIYEGQERFAEALVRWQQVVRTDPLRGAGFLSLAHIQLRLGQRGEARRTLEHLLSTPWEEDRDALKAAASTLLASLGTAHDGKR